MCYYNLNSDEIYFVADESVSGKVINRNKLSFKRVMYGYAAITLWVISSEDFKI
jgi:hypothetical protein